MRSPYDRPRFKSRHFVRIAKLVAQFIGLSVFALVWVQAGAKPLETDSQQVRRSQNETFAASLSDWLLLRPQDEEIRFLYARVLTWDQHWQASLIQYETLLASSPSNVDYLLGKAQVLVWSGQAAAAIPILEQAGRLAPDYEAIGDLHERAVAIANESASRAVAEIAALTIETPGAKLGGARSAITEEAQIDATNSFIPRAQILAAASMDFLDNGFEDWRSLFVGGDYRFSPRQAVYGEVRSTERFDQQDVDLTAGWQFPVSNKWSAFVQGSLGPDADILPQWSAMTGVRRSLPQNWGIEASYRHSEYALTYGDVMSVGLERYWRDYRFSYNLHRGKAEGAKATFSHVIRADFYYGDYDFIGFVVANGEEAESVGLNQLLVSDIETYGLMGQHWLTSGWALAWAADYHKQGKVYTRQGIYVGVKHKF